MVIDENMQGECVYATLYGLRNAILRLFGENTDFGISRLPITMNDNIKQVFSSEIKTGKDPYPYMYVTLRNIALTTDQNNIKNLARSGYAGQQTNDHSISRAFLFPSQISCDVHYVDADILRALRYSEMFVLVSAVGGMNYVVNYTQNYSWTVTVTLSGNGVDFSPSALEDPSSPGEFDVVASLTLGSKMGFIKSATHTNERIPSVNYSSFRDIN